MDRILELPKEILQRTLYFLSQEEAVRTSVLSKTWRYVWCARPNLDFSYTNFKGNKQEFLPVVDQNLQRYHDQRLCLEEFHLSLSIGYGGVSNQECLSLLEKWIPLLTGMGVNEFHLSILSQSQRTIDLPSVVFRAESLKLLHLKKFKLFHKIPENVAFERLQVLRLHEVAIENQIFFDKMISSCRFLTTMFFEDCSGLKTIKLEKKLHKYLKHFTFINDWVHTADDDECSIEIDFSTLETIKIIGCKVRFHDHKFGNLKSLTLKKVEFYCSSIEEYEICIDAPSIEYFDYSGIFIIPSISFTPTLRRSKLQLHFRWNDVDDARSWFLRLAKLLQALSQSEIHLNIVEHYRNNWHVQEDILIQDMIDGSNKPVVVEHLRLNIFLLSSCPSVLNVLFYICRPVKITPSWNQQGCREKQKERKELDEFFTKFQMIRESGNQGIMRDLEDLSIERFETIRREWHPLQGTTLLECASLHINNLRFRLKWREACESSSKIDKLEL